MPTLQQLRYLVALAETQHYRRAAEACNVTQPTLSAQLRALETTLGAALVERARPPAILTPAGRAVAERARRVLGEIEEIRALARAGGALPGRAVRLGVVSSLAPALLPRLVPGLAESDPRPGLDLREEAPERLLAAVADGALDAALCPLPLAPPDLVARALFREPLRLVLPVGHGLAEAPAVDPAALRGARVLALAPGHGLDDQVRRLCEDHGAELVPDYAGAGLDTLCRMVAAGAGLALVPALYAAAGPAPAGALVARPIRAAPPGRTIGLAWRRGAAREAEFRALADRFAAILRDRAPEVAVLG